MKELYWQQAFTLTVANLKTRYRNTVSGLLWVILNPMLIFGAQAVVFHFILKINVDRYPLFLVSALLPWIFVVQSVEMGTGVFTASGRLLKSFPVHPFIILCAQIFDNLFNFLIGFAVLLLPTVFYYHLEIGRCLLIPLAIIPLFVFTLGLVFFLATLQVFFWDTRFVMSFVMNVLFYLTPIVYPISMIDERFRWLMSFNPLWYILQPFQVAVVGDISQFGPVFLTAVAAAATVSLLSYINWERSKNELYFYI